MTTPKRVLGIESSCDDTAAAVVEGRSGRRAQIRSTVVLGQERLHDAFGGIVPELAARAHTEKIDHAIECALDRAEVTLDDLDAIAVTAGPGLIGGVLAGVMCAKGLSLATGLPLFGINHLAGHALTPRLTDGVPYPYLMLLVSGGHCQFLLVEDAQTFTRLGGTIDDAPGEAFDKIARSLGLPQPGGPHVEQCAERGDPTRFDLPRPLISQPGCDLSFSGLKTAAFRERTKLVDAQGGLTQQQRADLCASFQCAVADVLAAKTQKAIDTSQAMVPSLRHLCVAGGVAANQPIRERLEAVADSADLQFVAPPLALCTDNAAMIAYAAMEVMPERRPDPLSLAARPRWPLDPKTAPMLGGGRKGAKA